MPVAPRLGRVLWPLLAELLLGFAIGLAGLWLAARGGDEAAASFALSLQIVAAATLLFRVVSMGVSVVITQALGAGNTALAQQIAKASLGATTRFGVGLCAALLFASPWVLRMLGASAEVQHGGSLLVQCLAVALVFDGLCAAAASVLRANLAGRQAMWGSLVMHGIHLALAVLFMPFMGLAGFAVAMLVGRAVALALMLWHWRVRLHIGLERSDWWVWHANLLRGALRIGLPGAAETIAYRLAALAAVAVVAQMGTVAIAAHSYVQQLLTCVVLSTVALGFACEIVVGHLIGAGQLRQAQRLVTRVLWLGLVVSGALALASAFAAPYTLKQFSSDPLVLQLALPAMWVAVCLEPGRTCNVVVINALRAAGDAKFPVAVGAVSMLVVMAGGAWLLGGVLGLGLMGVWMALAADELLRGAVMVWRWRSLAWVPSARRMRATAAVAAKEMR